MDNRKWPDDREAEEMKMHSYAAVQNEAYLPAQQDSSFDKVQFEMGAEGNTARISIHDNPVQTQILSAEAYAVLHGGIPTAADIEWVKNHVLKGQQDTLDSSEAVYGFVAWLSTREKVEMVSKYSEMSHWATLVLEFCQVNNLPLPTEGWHKKLIFPCEASE